MLAQSGIADVFCEPLELLMTTMAAGCFRVLLLNLFKDSGSQSRISNPQRKEPELDPKEQFNRRD